MQVRGVEERVLRVEQQMASMQPIREPESPCKALSPATHSGMDDIHNLALDLQRLKACGFFSNLGAEQCPISGLWGLGF